MLLYILVSIWNKNWTCLGLFSLKKKIEDAVLRAESLATTALELEEARRIKQEEMVRNYNLWDDPTKSNEVLVKLADSLKVVNALKDLRYKVMCCLYWIYWISMCGFLFHYSNRST